ncbi:hypothetical protein CR970_04460 [Candidatus Saccharibacteria bacterium]|nr:MAG: hypothetical protein CR970_04460 [Candidatus Saccharibacteria bacterium]
MMVATNIKMALGSIRGSKWRSFLTMLGIIVGVMSVVTFVSLGEGVRQQVQVQTRQAGEDLITVKPGNVLSRDDQGNVTHIDLLQTFGGNGSLAETDWEAVSAIPSVGMTAPMSFVPGVPTKDDQPLGQGVIIGTTTDMQEALPQTIEFGSWFDVSQDNKNVAVVGQAVAHQLFGENAPVGQVMSIRGQSFVVAGVMRRLQSSPLTPGLDYNLAIFIPYETAKRITGGEPQIRQIYARPAESASLESTVADIEQTLRDKHGGQEDFTALRPEDTMTIANSVVTLLTGLISAVAAISLLVGGIGIMNIMLVSVSERTHEIGVRKAIGATNRQVMMQFVTESTVLSFVGGVLGVLGSYVVNYFLRVFTDLTPVITWQVVTLAIAVALLVGVFFGTAPALKAARKDPIEALREF